MHKVNWPFTVTTPNQWGHQSSFTMRTKGFIPFFKLRQISRNNCESCFCQALHWEKYMLKFFAKCFLFCYILWWYKSWNCFVLPVWTLFVRRESTRSCLCLLTASAFREDSLSQWICVLVSWCCWLWVCLEGRPFQTTAHANIYCVSEEREV